MQSERLGLPVLLVCRGQPRWQQPAVSTAEDAEKGGRAGGSARYAACASSSRPPKAANQTGSAPKAATPSATARRSAARSAITEEMKTRWPAAQPATSAWAEAPAVPAVSIMTVMSASSHRQRQSAARSGMGPRQRETAQWSLLRTSPLPAWQHRCKSTTRFPVGAPGEHVIDRCGRTREHRCESCTRLPAGEANPDLPCLVSS